MSGDGHNFLDVLDAYKLLSIFLKYLYSNLETKFDNNI